MTKIYSFLPLHSESAERLILGTMPGKVSLSAQQYYAHHRNNFWNFITELLELPPTLSYAERCTALVEHRIALWDVLGECVRHSSLDADIEEASLQANDFHVFLTTHPHIRHIYFNGAKAEALWRRHVQPQLSEPHAAIATLRLPSTSPANASIPLTRKLDEWRAITQ